MVVVLPSASLAQSFHELFAAGRLSQALVAAEKNLAVAEEYSRDQENVLAERYLDVAQTLIGLRLAIKAIAHLERALATSTDPRQRARIANIRAVALAGAGNTVEAERLLKELIELQAPGGTAFAADLSQNYYDLGNLQRELGRLEDAELSLQASLKIRRQLFGEGHLDVAATLVGLGNVRWQRGNYLAAKALYEPALAIMDNPTRPDHPALATALNNLASTFVELGKFEDAVAFHKRALAIRQISLGPENYEVSVSLNNLGNAFRELGRLFDSEEVLKRALLVRERWDGPNAPSVATILNNLGLVYAAMGRQEDAERIYSRAIGILQDRTDAGVRGLGQILSNAGRLLLAAGQNEKAEGMLRNAYDLSVRTRSPKHPEVATALNFLAVARSRLGRYDEAVSDLLRALLIRKESLGEDHPHTGITLARLANSLHELGQTVDAETRMRHGLGIIVAKLGDRHPESAGAMRQLGSILLDRGQSNEGFEYLRRSAAAQQSFEAFDFARFRSLDQIEGSKLIYSELVRAAALRSGDLTNQSDYLETAFSAAQLSSRSNASAALAQMSARFGSGAGPLSELVRNTQDFSELRKAIDRRLFAALTNRDSVRDESLVRTLRDEFADVESKLSKFSQRLKAEFPEYAGFAIPAPLTTDQVARELKSGEALVVFFDLPKSRQANEETVIWLVTPETSRWVVAPLGASALTEKILLLRCGLDSQEWEGISRPTRCGRLLEMRMRPRLGDPLPFDLGVAHELYRALLGPFDDLIKDKHLIIVPSGPLTSLPFQVLVTEQPQSSRPKIFEGYKGVAWLGRRQPLTVLPSVSSLQALRQFAKASTAKKPFLGYGDPVLLGDGGCRRATTTQACAPSSQLIASASDALPAREHLDVRSGSIDQIFSTGAGQDAIAAAVRALCPLPDTAFELRCVAKSLGVPERDSARPVFD
jgi:tetratricopeptide (TPR) repeat protein